MTNNSSGKIREILENHFYTGQSIDDIINKERHISQALLDILAVVAEEIPKKKGQQYHYQEKS